MQNLRLRVAFLIAISVGLVFAGLPPQTATGRSKTFETNVSNDPAYGGGEPEIAVNPTNTRNLVEVWMASAELYRLQPPPSASAAEPGSLSHCNVAYSTNRGATWHRVPFQTTDAIRSTCADPIVAADTGGRFYAGGACFNAVGMVTGIGGVCVKRSTDGGRSWGPTKMVATFPHDGGSYEEPREGLPGVISPWDRPWMAVDQSTHALYVEAIDHMDPSSAAPSSPNEGGFGRWYVTVSRDGAKTFGPMRPFDSDQYPSGGGGWMSAANGTLAAAYLVSNLPTAPDYSRCDIGCRVIFETSTNDGRTWNRHFLPVVKVFDEGTSDQLFEWLAADPSHPGRYAVMLMEASGTRLDVYVTRNSGKTWTKPAVLGGRPENQRFKPWLAYSPNGVLGAFWRTQYGDGSYDAWVAISRDGGLRFDPAVGLSRHRSPPYPPQYAAGDDFSFVALDSHYLHATWGDGRSGILNAWYGRIALTD